MKVVSKRRFRQIMFSLQHYLAEVKNCRDAKDAYFWLYFKKPYLFPLVHFPATVDIELTNNCNLSCIHCLSQRKENKRPLGFMDYEVFTKIADEMGRYPGRNLLICGVGEPVLHPRIQEMLSYLSEKRLRYTFYTNGTFMRRFTPKDIMNWHIETIVVSVDGIDDETHAGIRVGSDYSAIKEDVAALSAFRTWEGKRNPRIEIRHVIFPYETNNQLVRFRREWLKIADAVKFNFLISPSDKSTGLEGDLMRCRDIRRKMHVRWSGQVPLCGYQYIHDDYEWLVDIHFTTLEEIWNGTRLNEVRSWHKARAFRSVPFCRNCPATQP